MQRLSAKERELVFELAEKLTGTCQRGSFRKDILASNVERRMSEFHLNFDEYLNFASTNYDEKAHLLSSLTIHTTSWFREDPHFDLLESHISKMKKVVIWSAACSTGEEAYTAALICEMRRKLHPEFEYEIYGSDIDPKSVEKATMGIYEKSAMNSIPARFQDCLEAGSGPYDGKFRVSAEIRKRSKFFCQSLADESFSRPEKCDFIFCRNVLIYFEPEMVSEIVTRLQKKLAPGGVLILGHSEALINCPPELKFLSCASYMKRGSVEVEDTTTSVALVSQPTKPCALVIDDLRTIRMKLGHVLKNSGFDVWEARDAEEATSALKAREFSLITLDLHMPGVSGATWLKNQRAAGLRTPVLIVSDSSIREAEEVFGALECGAQDYIMKSELNDPKSKLSELLNSLKVARVGKHSDGRMGLVSLKVAASIDSIEVILVGASTGGPEALCELLSQMPHNSPPVVVVQHISPDFGPTFAKRLARIAGMKLGDTREKCALQRETIYISLGDYHLELLKLKQGCMIAPAMAEKESGHRPSIDFMFRSAARNGISGYAALLTGMGQDGALGLKELLQTKKFVTFAQDQESSVVYGMPAKAVEFGAANYQGSPAQIRRFWNQVISKGLKNSA